MHVCVHVCVCACVHVRVCVCMHVCVYAWYYVQGMEAYNFSIYIFITLSNSLSSIAPAQILSPQEPTAISVNETDSVSFVCTARGFPAVDITWRYQNTQLMYSDPRLSIQSMIVESDNGIFNTTSTLTIPSVDRSDAGHYTCAVSNTVFGSTVRDMQQFMLTVNCKYLAYEHV